MASDQTGTASRITRQKGGACPAAPPQALLDALGDGFWENDLELGISHLSEGWLRFFGYTTDDFPQPGRLNAWFAVVHPDDIADAEASYQRHLAGDTPHWRQELRIRDAKGTWRWVLSRGQIVDSHPDGRPVRIVGTHLDISEQKERTRDLAATRQRSRMLLDAVPDLVFIGTREGKVVECSGQCPEGLVATGVGLLGEDLRDVLPQDLAGNLLDCLRETIDSQRMQTLACCLPVNGADRHFEARSTPCGADMACCIVRDITAPKQTIQRLDEARREYEHLVRSLPVGVFSFRTGRDGGVRNAYVSPRMAELLDQPAELIAKGADAFGQYVHPADRNRARDIVGVLLGGEARIREEIRCCGRGGGTVWIHLEVQSGQASPDEILIRGTIADITAQKRSEEEHRQLQMRMQKSERMRALGQLAGGVAHEFNNQLNTVLFFVDSIRKDKFTADQLKRYADLLYEGAARTSDLTKKLLDFSRQGSPTRVVFDLHRVLSEFLDMLAQTLGRRIRIQRILLAEVPMLFGDPAQINSSLLNLSINARDAMAGAGTITFATESVCLDAAQCRQLRHENELRPGNYLCLSVSDTGSGMDPKIRERIFEPFFTTKPSGKGTGLGLAAVYGTVIDHSGAIKVETQPGYGTTFRIFLPTCASPTAPAPAVPLGKPVCGRGHLLLVDDETLLRILLREMLQGLGYQVTDCETGEEAVRLFEQSPMSVDAAVLDVAMAGMGGLDTYRALCRVRPGLPALAISGFSSHPDVPAMLREGVRELIPKPVDMVLLSHKLAELIQPRE